MTFLYSHTHKYLEITQAYLWAARARIFPKLRFVTLHQESEKFFELFFYVDGKISEDEQEAIHLIDTYIGVFLPRDGTENSWNIVRRDFPLPIHDFQGECIYARQEPIPLIKNSFEQLVGTNDNRRLRILLAMQRAMVNHIFPRIRQVGVSYCEQVVSIWIIIDGEISDNEGLALEKMQKCFVEQIPEKDLTHCKLIIQRMDFPENRGGFFEDLVYCRKEYLENSCTTPYDIYGNM